MKLIKFTGHYWPLASGHAGRCYVITDHGESVYEDLVAGRLVLEDIPHEERVRRTDPLSSRWAALGDRTNELFKVLEIFYENTREE